MIFFADPLGWKAIYNRHGVIHPDNRRLRVPPDFAAPYPASATRGEALNIPTVLALDCVRVERNSLRRIVTLSINRYDWVVIG